MRYVLIVAVLSLLLAAPAAPQTGAEPPADLLVAVSDVRTSGELAFAGSRRERTVDVRSRLLATGAPAAGAPAADTLRLALFPDLVVEARRVDRPQPSRGGSAWTGDAVAEPSGRRGQVTLIARGDRLFGSVRLPGHNVQIRPLGDGGHVVYEIDPARLTEAGDDFIPVDSGPPAPVPLSGATPIIDVLVVYTPATLADVGGLEAMEALIDLAEVETNTSYANSDVAQRLRIVGSAEVAYVESGSLGTDLSRLRGTSDGFLDEVHAMRDTYGADAVSLWILGPGCGIGYLMTSISPSFETSAFNVCQTSCATGNLTFGHELGHNMALRHDWYVDDTAHSPFTYNHGHVNADVIDPPSSWRTVMSYNNLCTDATGSSCTRLMYYSNPDVSIAGVPTGVPEGTSIACFEGNTANPPCDADNHKTLDNSAATFAAFRPTEVLATVSKAASTPLAAVGETIDYTLTVTNASGVTATGVVLTDTVPDHTTLDLVSLSGDAMATGTTPGSVITWTTGADLATGESLMRGFSVTAEEGGIATNVASVTSANTALVIPSNSVATSIWESADCGFGDDFESGFLSHFWRSETTADGRVRILPDLPDTGSFSAVLDDAVSDAVFSEASLILSANLAGEPQVLLRFRWTDARDEYHPTLDGVFIRESDLDPWVKVFDFDAPGDLDYRTALLDLVQLAAANGLALTDGFEVRFHFYDNFRFVPTLLPSSDGYVIDNVNLICQCGSDLECDDGVFCNGQETCDAGLCQAGDPPCPGTCDEINDLCLPSEVFSDGFESGDLSMWPVSMP